MKPERLMLLASVALAAFLYGALAMKLNLFPSRFIHLAFQQAESVQQIPHYLYPAVHERSGVTVKEETRLQPGVTLVTSYWQEFNWRAGIKLIDASGQVLHQWSTNPAEIWPELNARGFDQNYVHGSFLFPNGDVLFNIEHVGLVRMDSCGDVVWKQTYRTHHSISPTDDGNFWVAAANVMMPGQDSRLLLKKYRGFKAPIFEDLALKVAPNGEVLQAINLLDIVLENDLRRHLVKTRSTNSGDLLHLNDIEALSADMADQYPLFEAGDIVVSLRYPNLVMVIDPDTEAVKWHATDPFVQQHDPDFTGDGWITVFNNNLDHTFRGDILGGSELISIKPATGELRTVYPTAASPPFYTATGGKWQTLENGNLLIVEAVAGRVFETTPEGETVWEWVHERYNEKLVPEVLEGTRYPYSNRQISSWQCALQR